MINKYSMLAHGIAIITDYTHSLASFPGLLCLQFWRPGNKATHSHAISDKIASTLASVQIEVNSALFD